MARTQPIPERLEAPTLRSTVANWGVPPGLSGGVARRLRVANFYALLIATLITLLYAPFYYLWLGSPALTVASLLVALACAAVPAMHAMGLVRGGRYWLLLVSNASVLAFSLLLGPASGVHLLLLVVACAPLAMLDPTPRAGRTLFVGLSLSGLLVALAYGRVQGPLLPLPARLRLPFELSIHATVLGMLATVVLHYMRRSEAAGRELRRVHRAAQDELHEALRRSEERFRQLVRQAADALLFLDEQGHILDANEQASSDLGLERAELIARRVADFDAEGALVDAIADLDSLEAKGHATLETQFLRHDGSTYPVEVRVGIVCVDGTRHVLTLARNIEQRRAMEAKLMFADRMVSVGTLAAGVAHEINNPLTYLSMNLEYLRGREAQLTGELEPHLADRVRQAISRALDGSERVATIVRDLQTFARGDNDVSEVVDVNQVLESTLSLADGALRRRAEVDTELMDVPSVRASEARLGQVFMNLVLNAAQALDGTVGREPRIHIATRVADDQMVEVDIEDNGDGIDPAHLPRIFDPFFTTKAVGVGTGLGLFICQNIVRSFGGDISVQSARGEGTRVRLRMPPVRASVQGLSAVPASP